MSLGPTGVGLHCRSATYSRAANSSVQLCHLRYVQTCFQVFDLHVKLSTKDLHLGGVSVVCGNNALVQVVHVFLARVSIPTCLTLGLKLLLQLSDDRVHPLIGHIVIVEDGGELFGTTFHYRDAREIPSASTTWSQAEWCTAAIRCSSQTRACSHIRARSWWSSAISVSHELVHLALREDRCRPDRPTVGEPFTREVSDRGGKSSRQEASRA